MVGQQTARRRARCRGEGLAEHIGNHARHVPRGCPLAVELPVLPAEAEVEAEHVLRVVGVAVVAAHVVHVNLAVTVQVHINGVTRTQFRHLLRIGAVESLLIQVRRLFVVVAPEHILRPRPDAVSLLILVEVALRSFLAVDDLVLVLRQVEVCPVAEVVAELVIPLQGQFPSPAVDSSQVGKRHAEADDAGSGPVLQQDVGAVFPVVLEGRAQAVVEEVGVDTVVLFEGFLPTYVGIVLRCFAGAQADGPVLDAEVVSIASVAVGGLAVVDFIRVCQVEEAQVLVCGLVVAHKSEADAQLEEADVLFQRFEEVLLAEYPSR